MTNDEGRIKTLDLALTPDDANALTGLIAFAQQKGGPLESMAAHKLSDLMRDAMLAQMPQEAKAKVLDIIEGMENDEDCPDGLRDAIARVREDIFPAITEDEVANADVDELIDTTLADSIPPEAIVKGSNGQKPV